APVPTGMEPVTVLVFGSITDTRQVRKISGHHAHLIPTFALIKRGFQIRFGNISKQFFEVW
ncbi:hypothetical protein J8J23_20925, partial [Mycobacterium tuberculosis]|nr:hypothetical protein [Mycobacterium tuberculosis]